MNNSFNCWDSQNKTISRFLPLILTLFFGIIKIKEVFIILIQVQGFLPNVHERYFIDQDGQLYTDFGKRKMSNSYIRNGYISNTLYGIGHEKAQYIRHRLVLMAFCPVENMNVLQVNHKDGNKLNNNLFNLEWTTPKENTEHAWNNGMCNKSRGELHYNHKLTEQQVKEIYQKVNSGLYSISELARCYKVSNRTIGRIRDNQSWSLITTGKNFNDYPNREQK